LDESLNIDLMETELTGEDFKPGSFPVIPFFPLSPSLSGSSHVHSQRTRLLTFPFYLAGYFRVLKKDLVRLVKVVQFAAQENLNVVPKCTLILMSHNLGHRQPHWIEPPQRVGVAADTRREGPQRQCPGR
jgi:hypothetical protein